MKGMFANAARDLLIFALVVGVFLFGAGALAGFFLFRCSCS